MSSGAALNFGGGTHLITLGLTDRLSGAGTVTFSGGTTIGPGTTLQVGNGGTSGTLGSGDVTCVYQYYSSAAQLVFNRSNTVTVDNDISGFLSIVQQGSGALVLTGSNTYTQGTTIDSGKTLRIGSDDADVLPNGDGSGTVTVNGTLDLNGYDPAVGGLSGSGTVTSGVSGSASLTVQNEETLLVWCRDGSTAARLRT